MNAIDPVLISVNVVSEALYDKQTAELSHQQCNIADERISFNMVLCDFIKAYVFFLCDFVIL